MIFHKGAKYYTIAKIIEGEILKSIGFFPKWSDLCRKLGTFSRKSLFYDLKIYVMESKRQRQVAEMCKRNFSIILQQEGSYIYGPEALVTVTSVKMSPDMGLANIYLSVYNIEDKQNVLLMMEQEYSRIKGLFHFRIKKHVRRMPNYRLFLDDTLDEMWRLNHLFNKLEEDNQLGSKNSEDESPESTEKEEA